MTYPKISLAIATAILGAAPALGQTNDIVVEQNLPTAIVSYADLDLSRPAGVAALNGRVRAAAKGLCVHNGVMPIEERTEQRNCLASALAGAQRQIEIAVAQANGGPRLASRNTITLSGR